MAELLLELFSEEIPARMQSKASSDLKNALLAKLKNLDIKFEQADAYSTPRRLTIHIQGLPLNLPEVREEKKGPKVNAPESAISGFLGSSGLNKDQLEIRKVGNDEVYFAVTTKAASESSQVLITIINDLIAEFTWPKSMRWGEHKIRWVRPLKNILCLFDKKVLPVSFGHLIANNKTWGHRFLGSQFTAEDFGSYSNQLRVNKVILSADERKQLILEQAQKIAAENNFLLRQEDALLEEVTGLVEWPIVMLGKIDKEFMHIPKEVLITSMRSHQKYFSLENADKNFAPYFIFVANIEASDGGKKIIQGNERVLRARLADAKFFYELDLNMTLENMIPKLAKVTFHAKLGNILEKVERMKHVAKILPGNRIINFRAIELSKADLMSQMVGEFPELQGIMGYYYAIADQEDQKVATAIRDHYKPISQDDEVPKDQVAINVALADRIVTIVGFFIIGEKPNGSKDPYALRRAAIGIIRNSQLL
jgi:glycyl-tRNA synthetase beta chain